MNIFPLAVDVVTGGALVAELSFMGIGVTVGAIFKSEGGESCKAFSFCVDGVTTFTQDGLMKAFERIGSFAVLEGGLDGHFFPAFDIVRVAGGAVEPFGFTEFVLVVFFVAVVTFCVVR